jgi:hypothetical protein
LKDCVLLFCHCYSLLQVKFQRVTEAYKALTTPGYHHEHESDDEHSGEEEGADFDEFTSQEALFELFNMMFGDSGLDDSDYDDDDGFGDPMDMGELLEHLMPGLGSGGGGGVEAAMLAELLMRAGYSDSEDGEERSDDDDGDDDSAVESTDEPDEEDMIAAAMVSTALSLLCYMQQYCMLISISVYRRASQENLMRMAGQGHLLSPERRYSAQYS